MSEYIGGIDYGIPKSCKTVWWVGSIGTSGKVHHIRSVEVIDGHEVIEAPWKHVPKSLPQPRIEAKVI